MLSFAERPQAKIHLPDILSSYQQTYRRKKITTQQKVGL
jgi:hypothetical protein